MGRREDPIDPEAGPVPRFAHRLRELRRAAGGPTYREMALRAGYSAPALSQAAAGKRLPSLAVALAYAEACGGDPGEWERWWREAAAEAGPVEGADEEPPYPGLARFEPRDAGRFFGRERAAADLLRLVAAHRFAGLVGASGSGKSSLVRAGLVPRLTAPDFAAARILAPGEHPVRAHARLLEPAPGEGDTLVVVDQFEEVFTLCADPAERAAFVELLLAAPVRVLVVVRADFYGRCAEHPGLAGALGGAHVLLGPPTAAELREVVVRPAAAAGLVVERALTARVVEEVVDQPGALPLVSHALLETWRRRRGRTLTLAGYEAAGGVRGALARTAEEVHARFDPERAEVARRVLLRLIAPGDGDGAPDTRRPARREELGGAAGTDLVLERLARARLVTLDGGAVELAHEALITAWPRLREWVARDRARLRLHRRLTEAAHLWEELDRDPDALYRGARLSQVRDWRAGGGDAELNPAELAFVAASVDADERERAQARRRARTLRWLAAAVAVLLFTAVVGLGVASWQVREARRQGDLAESRGLAARAQAAMAAADVPEAARFALRAHATHPSVEARGALLSVASRPAHHGRLGSSARDVVFDPGGDVVASLDSTKEVVLWDVRTWRQVGRLGAAVAGSPTSLAFDRRGRVLAAAYSGGEVVLWDVGSRRVLRVIAAHDGSAVAVAFDPAGDLLATTGTDGRTRLWGAADGAARGELPGPSLGVARGSLAFGPRGGVLAAGGEDGRVTLWDLARRTEVARLPSGRGAVDWVVFSPDGGRLAVVDAEGVITVWDAATWRVVDELIGDTSGVRPAFLPGGDDLVAADRDGGLVLWTPGAATRLLPLPPRAPAQPARVAVAPDGRAIAAATDVGVLLWLRDELPLLGPDEAVDIEIDVRTGEIISSSGDRWRPGEAPRPRRGRAPTGQVAMSHDGTRMASVERGGVVVRDTTAPADPGVLVTASLSADAEIALSADGRLLAVAAHGAVGIWAVDGVRRLEVLDTGMGQLSSLAFSPGGHHLIGGGAGLVVWDMGDWSVAARHEARGGPVVAVAADRAADRVVMSTSDGELTLWERGRGPVALPGGAGAPRAASFSPDGRLLATAGDDGGIVVWDAAGAQEWATLVGHRGGVTDLAWSPDGRTLFSSGKDRTIAPWQVDPALAKEKLCGFLRLGFSTSPPEC